jgi:hypothetical protein
MFRGRPGLRALAPLTPTLNTGVLILLDAIEHGRDVERTIRQEAATER